MKAVLGVATALAAPFDLMTMLAAVVQAATQVLDADRGSVWLYDVAADELVLEVATTMRQIRIPAGSGIVGACARNRAIINVPDCYGDPRFDRTVDRQSGYRTRCMLTLPLIDHKDVLVGVMQVLNKREGVFDADDELLAAALAAQCAIALQRVRMTQAVIEGEKMRQELETARVVQMSTLPATMPRIDGYDAFGAFEPAELTGGDTFDLAPKGDDVLVVLADATGHGIAPALSVTQMQAMLRMAFRLGANLEAAVMQVNNQLAEWLPPDRFITAFVGLLNPSTHRLEFHSAGQAPILHFQARTATCVRHGPTSFPLGAMHLPGLRPSVVMAMQPGDMLLLLSDGVYEYRGADDEEFGVERVEAIVAAQWSASARDLVSHLLEGVRRFAAGAPQEDDITVVIVKRLVAPAHRVFPRRIDAIDAIFAFTAEVMARDDIDDSLRASVDFALEELFTNMVKYSASSAQIRVDIEKIAGGLEVKLTDYDVEPFDVTAWPDVDVSAPIEQRRIGGLGLHLIRRLLDSIDYAYDEDRRESRITFRKTCAGEAGRRAGTGESHAGH
ncbi:MAG: SpoIIE family protein phosphatase [Casimicrobiaceae bacterium]